MRSLRFMYIIATIAITVILFDCNCNKTNNPAAPVRNVLFTEGFEADTILSDNYQQVTYMTGWGMASVSANAAHSGTHSLTTDSNLAGIKKRLDTEIQDSTAGLEFYLMAKKAEHINLFAALAQTGSTSTGLNIIMGMGISMSDSLYCNYENALMDSGPIIMHQNFAALQFNKWYKCNIEYNFSASNITYFLDGAPVKTITVPVTLAIPFFMVMRDNLGASGSKDYYIDDITIYKK